MARMGSIDCVGWGAVVCDVEEQGRDDCGGWGWKFGVIWSVGWGDGEDGVSALFRILAMDSTAELRSCRKGKGEGRRL